MVSSAAFILSAKALLISIGAASMALLLKVSVPLIVEFMISQVPLLWCSILSWLRPPYLYIVINGIIISIAASSRLHRSNETSQEESPLVEAGAPDDSSSEMGGALEPGDDLVLQGKRFTEEDMAYDAAVEGNTERDDEEEKDEEFVISKSTWTPAKRSDSPVQEYLPQPSEKPLASSRFLHRRPAKSNPEGTMSTRLKVARPKRHETLENTWKAITEGQPMPLTRQLRKSDTWENGHGPQAPLQLSSPQEQQKMMRKSETFRDRTNELEEWSPSPGMLRRAASPSKDELNRRVEAFIRKFNEEMRLQRQESLNHYKQMISRSADDY